MTDSDTKTKTKWPPELVGRVGLWLVREHSEYEGALADLNEDDRVEILTDAELLLDQLFPEASVASAWQVVDPMFPDKPWTYTEEVAARQSAGFIGDGATVQRQITIGFVEPAGAADASH